VDAPGSLDCRSNHPDGCSRLGAAPVTNPPPPTAGAGLPPLPAPPRAPQFEGSALTPLPPGAAERPAAPERVGESPDGFSADAAITTQLDSLEAWARANERIERQTARRFWGLHAVALLSAVLGSAVAPLWGNLPLAVILLGVAALCIVIEAVSTSSDRLGVAQRRALHELRELQHLIQLRWDAARLAFPNPYHPRRVAHALSLLDTVGSRREEIGRVLGASHASPAAALSLALGNPTRPRPTEPRP
jgi:hypothetical protein